MCVCVGIVTALSHWGGEGWRSRLQVPSLARQGPGHPRGGGSVRRHGCRAQRPALLLPVHPHGGHRSPQARFHHLPPLSAASPQGSLCHQLVGTAHDAVGIIKTSTRQMHVRLINFSDWQDPDTWRQKRRVHSVLGWRRAGHWANPAAEGVWCRT